MKFFTLDLLQREDNEKAWEQALADYENHLRTIRAKLPASVRKSFSDRYCLHDARVLAAGTEEVDPTFFVAVQFEDSNEGLWLTFRLAAPPKYVPSSTKALPVRWAYEELDVVTVGGTEAFLMSILFSDDAELQLTFTDCNLSRFRALAPDAALSKAAS